jgi:hypothetical protein
MWEQLPAPRSSKRPHLSPTRDTRLADPSGAIPEHWPSGASRSSTPSSDGAKIDLTDRIRLQSALAAAVTAVVCVVAVTACGGAEKLTTTHASAGSNVGPVKIVRARRMRPSAPRKLHPGTRVSGDFAGIRAFLNRRDGFGIGAIPVGSAETYPLSTTDGGKTWRTAGPVLYVPAAQAPLAVAQAGMVTSRLWYTCCGFDTVVDVTPDAGSHWWQTFLPGEVLSVYGMPSACGRELVALIQPYTKPHHPASRIWAYASTTGRRWTRIATPSAKLPC